MALSTLLDLGARLWPAQVGSRDWRYGAAGLLLSALVTPLLGLAVAMAGAFFSRSVRAVRVLSVVAVVAGALLALVLIVFLVDYVALAPKVEAPLKLTFTVATVKAVILSVLVIPSALALGLGGLRALRPGGDTQSAHRGGFVVGQPS